MTRKKNITELDNAISAKEKELARAQQEKRAAAHEPERLVLAEKVEQRISSQLRGLRAARAAADYTPPAPSDSAELLQGLQKYRDEHAAKVEQVRASIAEAEAESREIEDGLHRAAVECDAAATIDLTDRQRDNAAKLDALREMEERVRSLPVFPDQAISKEWAAICEKTMPDWKATALRVETLAEEYRAACADFLRMYDTLMAVRAQLIKAAAAEDGVTLHLKPVFTVGMDTERMIVRKDVSTRISSINEPLTGAAL